MTEKTTFIPARLKSSVVGGHVAGAEDIIDDVKGLTQDVINADVDKSLSENKESIDILRQESQQADQNLSKQINDNKTKTDSEISALKAKVDTKQDRLEFDNAPETGSSNPVKSDGIKRALGGKQDTISDLQTIRSNAAKGATALQEHQSLAEYYKKDKVDELVNALGNALRELISKKQDIITVDSSPTKNSNNPISSDAVYDLQTALIEALKEKQEKLTFDNTPTVGSGNPVTSGGVAAALSLLTGSIENIDFSGFYTKEQVNTIIERVDGNLETLAKVAGVNSVEELEKLLEESNLPTVPTKVSELENDKGYITKADFDKWVEENGGSTGGGGNPDDPDYSNLDWATIAECIAAASELD